VIEQDCFRAMLPRFIKLDISKANHYYQAFFDDFDEYQKYAYKYARHFGGDTVPKFSDVDQDLE